MKLFLKAALLSATFAVAGVAYAAGPTGTGMPTTPPNDTTGTDRSTPSDQPADTNTNSNSTTAPNGSSTDTNTGNDRSNTMSSRHRMGYSGSRHGSSMHMASSRRYREQCSELRSQWQDASMQHRHMRHYASAKSMAMKGEHSCKMRSSSSMKTGVMHLRSAIRRLGEKPSI
jgi:hypothetical protein